MLSESEEQTPSPVDDPDRDVKPGPTVRKGRERR
jgi:hypothetical protein